MKKLMPWFCLVATAGVNVAFANDGLGAYRQGNYDKAAMQLVDDQKKDAIVDYYMGRMRLYGYGQLKNNIIALRYLRQAAQKGLLPAQRMMGSYALIKEKNPEEALVWFKKAADANDIDAQMYCAAAYLFGVGTHKNTDAARRYYIAAAKNGNSIAQYALGESFLESRDSSSKKLGLLWLEKAVAQNNAAAQAKLGGLYASGTLVDADMAKAKELINLSISQGYLPALYQMGEVLRKEGDVQQAKDLFTKAINAHVDGAEMGLAQLYLQAKSPMYDARLGFLWMLKAAQNNVHEAQIAVSLMYKNGQGVEKDEKLAAEWKKKSTTSVKDNPELAQIKAAKWLSQGKFTTLAESGYDLHGILNDWRNPNALKENNYNQAPKMDVVTREAIYKPEFVLTNPNNVAISEYYDALAVLLDNEQSAKLNFPQYPIDKQAMQAQLAAASVSNNAPSLTDFLIGRAVLGDSTAQFILGQMYQDGVELGKNTQEAIKYYQLAAAQQELRAQYNLAILYLEGRDISPDYAQAMTLLRDAAFKGNDYAQYGLALIYEHGYKNAAGEVVIPADPSQAVDMFNLAAANDYGLAQYRLAEIMVREKNVDMTVAVKQKRQALIKQLYENAFASGVAQAALPLAFFNAMDTDKAKQAQAFEVAKKEANAGHPGAALLLGLLYDRGIAVPQNHKEALNWYQKEIHNPVSSFIVGSYLGIGNDKQKSKELLQKAADAGFSYANLNLAVMKQQNGEAFLPELEKALSLGNSKAGLLLADYYLSVANDDTQMQQARNIYQQLAEKGNKEGQLKLGFMFDQGLGGAVDEATAEKWYSLAAEQGQEVAQYLLGRLYQLGMVGSQPDYLAAKKWYSSAQSNYAPAAVALGFVYDTVDDDYQHALLGYQKAAEKQDANGQFNMGLIFEQGKGRPVDYQKAQEFYTQAAGQGHSQAMVQLAGLFFNGLVGSRDGDKALEWYKKAAALGDRDALYQLGLLSETGVATKLDLAEAVHYYQDSADKGNAKAMLALARMYQFGLGVPKDSHRAEKLYESLAALGNAFAQYQLANIYYEGIDGTPMPEKGKQLLQQAEANGSPQARGILQRLNSQNQDRSSFVEPVIMNQSPVLGEKEPADLMYLDALNEWNRGDERSSRMILNQIKQQFPDYVPAKRAYEQLDIHINPAIKG